MSQDKETLRVVLVLMFFRVFFFTLFVMVTRPNTPLPTVWHTMCDTYVTLIRKS